MMYVFPVLSMTLFYFSSYDKGNVLKKSQLDAENWKGSIYRRDFDFPSNYLD